MNRGGLLAAGAIVALMPAQALAREPARARSSNAALEAMVRQQAEALRVQQARIDALEKRVETLTLAASAPVPVPPAAVAAPPPQLAVTQSPPPTVPLPLWERLRKLPAGNAAMRPETDAMTVPSPSEAAELGHEDFDWSKGLPKITSADGKYTARLRGRMLFDTSHSFGSRFGARNISGTEFRSVRLGIEGKAGDNIAYTVEADFADDKAELRSAYVSFSKKWGKNTWELSFGNRLTDRSFDGASSSDSMPLLERGVAALATAPAKGSFGLGAMLRVFAPTWHAAIQLDGNAPSDNGTFSDSTTLTGRVHWNPWRSAHGIVHLGVWGYREWLSAGAEPVELETHLGGHFNDLITTGATSLANPDHGQAYGFEAGGTWRSLWVFGEYGRRDVYARDAAGGRHVDTTAGSIAVGYYLTGEKAPYVARGGTWSKPRVLRPLTEGGSGAFEIAARYDRLSYSGPAGGEGWSATLGVNWYLLDWVRLSVDGIHWRTDDRAGMFIGGDDGNTLYSRVQISF